METEQEKIERNGRVKAEHLLRIEDGGVSHIAWVSRSVGLPGVEDPVNPVVELANDDDGYYVQVFRNRSELQAFISSLNLAADDAWPPQDA